MKDGVLSYIYLGMAILSTLITAALVTLIYLTPNAGFGPISTEAQETNDTWSTVSDNSAPSPRYSHVAVWTGSKMIVWGGLEDNRQLNTGGIYDPANDTWRLISTQQAPEPRHLATAVWTGSKMIVWGGYNINTGIPTNTGGIYDPANDTWRLISTTNAPSGRYFHTAVWTGSKMIVWGGIDHNIPTLGPTNTGGIYDPANDTWRLISNFPLTPTPRFNHSAVWTGSKMIVWGGSNSNYATWVAGSKVTNEITGGTFDPELNIWTPISIVNAPEGRQYHSAVWTGSKMIVWGGIGKNTERINTGGLYDLSTDSWTATNLVNAPLGRNNHSTVWTGNNMIVWGGCVNTTCTPPTNEGALFNPESNSWSSTSTNNSPSARYSHTGVWTGTSMIIWGGILNLFNQEAVSGGIYLSN